MTDPAVEAAVRALDVRADNRVAQGAAAAREALAPIRELHSRVTTPGYQDDPWCQSCAGEDAEMDLRRYSWPCPTALLCYTTDEIQGVGDE